MLDAQQRGFERILSFGGAYSNHIYALAAAGKHFGFSTTGIIRGHQPKHFSKTLQFAQQAGMKFIFVSKVDYKLFQSEAYLPQLKQQHPNTYIIPVGGSNPLAIDACAEYISQLPKEYNYICTPVGSGGTITGFIDGSSEKQTLVGIPVLKNADFLYAEIKDKLKNVNADNWELVMGYDCGGYGKSQTNLNSFIINFLEQHNIVLEPVYTGKMVFAIYELIKKNHFPAGSNILVIHTGGLQGLDGFPELKKQLNKKLNR